MQAIIIPQEELENLRFEALKHGAEAAGKFAWKHRKEIGDVAKSFMKLQNLAEEVELQNLGFGSRFGRDVGGAIIAMA